MLLRLFFGRHVDPDLTRERLVRALDAAESRSEEFARVRTEIQEQPDAADAVYWVITLSAGEHAARARITWAREALDLLDRSTAHEARRGAGPGAQRVSTSASEVTERPERDSDPRAPA